MSGAAVGCLGFVALLVTGLAIEASARRRDAGVVTAAQSLAAAMRTWPGRAAVLTGWVWLGVHFLAR